MSRNVPLGHWQSVFTGTSPLHKALEEGNDQRPFPVSSPDCSRAFPWDPRQKSYTAFWATATRTIKTVLLQQFRIPALLQQVTLEKESLASVSMDISQWRWALLSFLQGHGSIWSLFNKKQLLFMLKNKILGNLFLSLNGLLQFVRL